jgi:outer membrane protein assembly factor BamB
MLLSVNYQVDGQTLNSSWNQFRGPDRNGTVNETLGNLEPGSTALELIWKKPIGSGFSELTVQDGRIFTMESEKLDSSTGFEFVSCFDASDATTIWRTKIDSMFFDTFGDGPRSTPVIGEKKIYSLSSYGKLTALDKTDGKIVWQVDVLKEFSPTLPRWGFSSSSMLLDQILIIEAGGTDQRAFMAFDIENGKPAWQNGAGTATYCSPIMATIDGIKQLIFANQNTLYSLNPQGDTLWTHLLSTANPTAMPLFFGGNKIFVSSLAGRGFSVVEIKGNTVTEILKGSSMKNDFSSSLYHNGYFYGFNVAALQCISADDGLKRWTKRGLGKGSLIKVDNTLLALSDKGLLVIIKAESDAYHEIGTYQVLEGKSWTAPSFADGKIYLRNLTEMACYKIAGS